MTPWFHRRTLRFSIYLERVSAQVSRSQCAQAIEFSKIEYLAPPDHPEYCVEVKWRVGVGVYNATLSNFELELFEHRTVTMHWRWKYRHGCGGRPSIDPELTGPAPYASILPAV